MLPAWKVDLIGARTRASSTPSSRPGGCWSGPWGAFGSSYGPATSKGSTRTGTPRSPGGSTPGASTPTGTPRGAGRGRGGRGRPPRAHERRENPPRGARTCSGLCRTSRVRRVAKGNIRGHPGAVNAPLFGASETHPHANLGNNPYGDARNEPHAPRGGDLGNTLMQGTPSNRSDPMQGPRPGPVGPRPGARKSYVTTPKKGGLGGRGGGPWSGGRPSGGHLRTDTGQKGGGSSVRLPKKGTGRAALWGIFGG